MLQTVASEYPETRLLIAGTGDSEHNLRAAFARTGLNKSVDWIGRFTIQDICRLLHDRLILIDPVDGSITQRAKSSFRTALAAAAGLPVVSSDIGIRPFMLPPSLHHRFFARPGDAEDYAQKIISLIESPISEQDQNQLRRHSQRHTWENLSRRYIKLLQP
jgi:glycosyltransferase involved in cell wall biosynthesis